jgi:hypothetical protein
MTDGTESGPFGRAVALYRSAGWIGAMPIGRAPGQKSPPPSAFTGHGKPYPSGADTFAWADDPSTAALNIGVRANPGTIGLDIDAGYSKVEHGKTVVKRGEDTLRELEARFGPLPPTWVSSARPAPSGIRWFRVPTHLDGREVNWPGEAGKFIEIIQPGHRYGVVWPSTNPDADGAEYRWSFNFEYEGDWPDDMLVPRPDALPWLPEPWVRGLMLDYDRTEKSDLAGSDVAGWYQALRNGEPCPVIHTVCTRAVHNLKADEGARHETARDALAAIVRLGGDGHRGVPAAVAALAQAFSDAVGAERANGGEWQRLLVGAVRLAATDNRAPRQSCDHDPATQLVVPEGFTMPEAVSPGLTAAPASGALTLPDEFWTARDSLNRIRQAAHSRVRSADVVFYGTLCRLSAMAPHTLRADTGIGTPASLNLFAAIVGPSGGGKSSGLSVSRDLVKTERHLEEFPLGSGEGMAEAYMGEATEPTGDMARDGSAKMAKVRKQVRHNALFHSDEGATLNKLIERAGSTVGETLRSAWSGEAIGQKNGRVETTRTVPSRSYACGLMIGYQPTTVLPLLADAEAGTPQRFLYAWAVDGGIPGRAARVPWPGEMLSPFPADVPTDLPSPGTLVSAPPLPDLTPVTFAAEILDELYDMEHAKNIGALPFGHWLTVAATGELDEFKSQHPVLKVKVAALLALLEGRRHVGLEDWRLAQIVLDTSDRVREYLQALARLAAGKARAAALAAEAEAEHYRAHARASVTEALDLTAERRVAVRVAVRVHEHGPQTLGALKKGATSADRKHVEAGIEIARVSGWLDAGDDGRIHPGASRPAV